MRGGGSLGLSTKDNGLLFKYSHLIACATTADKLTLSRNTLKTDTSVKRFSCHFSKSALLNSSNNTAPKGVFAIRFNRNTSDLAPPLLTCYLFNVFINQFRKRHLRHRAIFPSINL